MADLHPIAKKNAANKYIVKFNSYIISCEHICILLAAYYAFKHESYYLCYRLHICSYQLFL
jgi:hypothetical protein